MPFQRGTVEMIRERFVKEALSKQKTLSALCREYGISRPTAYLWLNRFESGEGLSDKSKAPLHTRNKTSEQIEALVVAARKKEPAIGAVKIKRMLENHNVEGIPCASTINAILKRNGLISKAASLKTKPHVRFEKEQPNRMWQCDFKGNYRLSDAMRCYPLSILDDHSRYCLNADAQANEQFAGVAHSFVKCFTEYGLPDILLCDNGNPWGASQSGGVTRFEVWLMDLGILTIHIRAKHPQTQGKVERFNGSFKAERLKFYTPRDMQDAQRQRLEYQAFYNNERPHHALGLDTPSQHYSPSGRRYCALIAPWELEDGGQIRVVKRSGYLTYEGQGYYLSEAYGGRTVEVRPSSVDGYVNLYYRQFRIGRLNLSENAVVSRRIYLTKNDPRLNAQGSW